MTSLQKKRNMADTANEIVDHIEIGILFGEYRPRQHLVQDQLAGKFQVERNIIRAVLGKLEDKRIVQHYPNRGFLVKEFTVKEAKDLYRVRFMLECTAAKLAVENINTHTFKQLEKLNDRMKRHLDNNELKRFTLVHEEFHQMIFDTAGNLYLSKLTKELRSASVIIRNFSYSRYAIPETKQQLLDEHHEMIICLKKGDRDGISDLSGFHIRSGINYYLRFFFPEEDLLTEKDVV
jgi:DNA-binding GntR family transcriptional regulator